MPEKTIEELEDTMTKMRDLIDYHILTASDYLQKIYTIQDLIENKKKQQAEKALK